MENSEPIPPRTAFTARTSGPCAKMDWDLFGSERITSCGDTVMGNFLLYLRKKASLEKEWALFAPIAKAVFGSVHTEMV